MEAVAADDMLTFGAPQSKKKKKMRMTRRSTWVTARVMLAFPPPRYGPVQRVIGCPLGLHLVNPVLA